MQGEVTVEDTVLTFVGTQSSTPKKTSKQKTEVTDAELPMASIKSDTYFQSGDITGELRISSADLRIFFRLGSVERTFTTVGFGVQNQTYGLASVQEGEQTLIAASGHGSKAATNQWLPFRIRVRGSQLEFFIDGVQVIQGTVRIQRAQLIVRFVGVGTAEMRNIAVDAIKPQAFVVMQFTDEYTDLFREVIDPVCSEFGYQVIRGDNVYTNGLIIEDIARSIRECSIVIADITPNNANVFYELGYAHGIGKPAILLSDRNREKLPFDISGFRLLFYDNTIAGKKQVEDALKKHLDALRGA